MKLEKLGNVFPVIRNGANIKQDKVTDGYPITRIETIADGTIDLSRVGYASIHDETFSDFYLQENDILMSHINSVSHLGKVALVTRINEKVIHGMNLLCLKADESKVHPTYSFYFLKSPIFRSKIKTITKKSVNQASFNISNLKNIEIPVPPLPDQLHIANLLSKAENLIAQRKESIRLLDEFLKSTFLEMFGNTRHYTKSDVVKTIGEICNTRGGGTPSKAKPEYYTGEIPWVSPKDMKWLYIKTSQDKITQQAIDESSTALIPKGSLLMVIRSGILKSKLPLAINKVDVTINQDMKAFTSKEVTTEYLLYFFFSEERNILKKVKGTTADNLNFDDIKKMKIKIPPIELQTQFAQIVEKTEALKTQYQQSLQELESLYGSLSQKAFRGELSITKAVSV